MNLRKEIKEFKDSKLSNEEKLDNLSDRLTESNNVKFTKDSYGVTSFFDHKSSSTILLVDNNYINYAESEFDDKSFDKELKRNKGKWMVTGNDNKYFKSKEEAIDFVIPQYYSVVVSSDGYADIVQTFKAKSEKEAQKELNKLKSSLNFDVVKGTQILGKRVGKVE